MNRVVHFEIQADDMDRAEAFYKALFGWEFQHMGAELGNYRVIVTGPGPDDMAKGVRMEDIGINGGMMQRNAPLPESGRSPNAFTCIIGVDDIDAYIRKANAAGGVSQTEKMDIPGVGKVIYYKDTEGNIFGMIQPVAGM